MALMDKLTGALLVAVLLSTILFGILTVQTYLYFVRFPFDRNSLKRMVIVLWVIDFVHQACACRSLYHYVTNFRDPEILARSIWSISAFHSLEPILALAVQIFFVHRFRLLNPQWWPLAFAMGFLAVVSFGFGFAAAIRTYSMEYFHEFAKDYRVVITWLSTCAACDIIIASGIAYSLHRSRTGVKATDWLITRLIVWTINTGAFPAFFALLELVFYVTMTQSFTFIGTDIVLARLYSNSLVAFLNRRKSPLDNKCQVHTSEDLELITLDFAPPDRLRLPVSKFAQPPPPAKIHLRQHAPGG